MSPIPQSLPSTRDSHKFLRFLRKMFPSSSRMDAVRTNEPVIPLITSTSTTLHQILRHQHFPYAHIPLTSTFNLVALSDRSCIAGYHRCSSPGKLAHIDFSPVCCSGRSGDDDSLIRDEDCVLPLPNPSSRPGSVSTGQHGRGRFFFCF
ncbi:hypothetical protein BDR07DRAFT_1398591 [Suillus spraguei]|nr:hypothetical protein BDR07DRAFT_1398591 [Suillus spraguei]